VRRAGAPASRPSTSSELRPVPPFIDLSAVNLEELDVGSLNVCSSEHLTLDGEHAVSVRDTDPLALALFALLRNDCHADRLLVWQELGSTLDGELNDDGRLALAAARVCCDDLVRANPDRVFRDRPLSEREYRAWWLADEARRRSWPSVSSVRRWLGGTWADVVEHLGQTPTAHSLGLRLAAQLAAFTPAELAAQLALCRKELAATPDEPLDYVTQREHRNWALRRLRDDDLPLPRLCLQPHPFRDVFGSWGAAVAASGGCQTQAGRRAATSTAQRHHAYSRQVCIDAVRYVGAYAGGATMRWPDYNKSARTLRMDPDLRNEVPAVLPAAATIAQKLGSWPQALHLAGFIDAYERDRRLARVTVTLSDQDLLKVLADAIRAIGADASKRRYRRYREAMRAAHGPHIGLPSLATVYQRLGGWADAKAAVAARFPDTAACTPTWTEQET
jgi:hypothetical protein